MSESTKDSTKDLSDSPPSFYNAPDEDIRNLTRELSRVSTHRLDAQDESASDSELGEKLARTMSSYSQVPGMTPISSEGGAVDPRLDPDSDAFDAKLWVKNLRKITDLDEDHYKPASLGIGYRNLRAYGIAADADYLPTVLNIVYKYTDKIWRKLTPSSNKDRYFDILKPMDGLFEPGTLTVVLGRPGAGCSTLLKTISSHTPGFWIGEESEISYDGLKQDEIRNHYRGSVVYNAESDIHFPHLTVYQTLSFAAMMKTPRNRFHGVSRKDFQSHITRVYMAMYGLSHTANTKVGDNLVRGVSGGERKRVSIAEVSICGSQLQCWDNATRGLDAATALEFIRSLKISASYLDTTSFIAIYQCSQDAYDLFDNVVVLYEGYQIYCGPGTSAKDYFLRMGWECPPRQTTADFLTSLTSPAERIAQKGMESKVPKTPAEFEAYWKASPEYAELQRKLDKYFTSNNDAHAKFHEAHVAKQAKNTRKTSSYMVSYWMQVRYNMLRNIWRTKGDPSITLFSVLGNVAMGLVIASIFYNLPHDTGSFYYRGAAMFFAVLFNAFSSLLEILSLYESRPIVEKHRTYAMYHPSAQALSSVITELPPKLATSIGFNLIYYFLVNFRRNPGRFFFYFLIMNLATLSMSHIFRTIGSGSTSLPQALTPASVFLLALTIYAGFAIPTPSMLGWSRWINYLNPVGYAFEALMVNEFAGAQFTCTTYVPSGPGYDNLSAENRVCSVAGSMAGQSFVDGNRYLKVAFDYSNGHKWRNFGIILAFVIVFLVVCLVLAEYNESAIQKGERLLFQRSTLQKLRKQNKVLSVADAETTIGDGNSKDITTEDPTAGVGNLAAGTDIFHWRNVCYDVKIKKETRRILSGVDGWVKPGTLTALMGASGAGKTTLLDVLANRVTMGVVSGDMFVNGHLRDSSFQRSTGYVQQQDLHLNTSTVREALRFSAILRQPASVPIAEKYDYVENVINILEMQPYADAIVGVAGEGLNVEQRKRLTIGVELAAKPQLLLFLDEPTSGLDSQTAWSICQLMRKLADNGQAILCTIHQPSAILLKEFDRLLFLAKGGRTIYFGDLGENCSTLIDYFENLGAPKCPPEANPAEWMLEVIGAAPGSKADRDYHECWLNSAERQAILEELDRMERELVTKPRNEEEDADHHKEFAASFFTQYMAVCTRGFQQYWRSPSYVWSKMFLTVSTSLFNGFSFFKADNSLQGLQNQMFSIFMFFIVFHTLVDQMLPYYVSQRDLYEARERPSKTFSWVAFILAQLTVEIPYQVACGTVAFFCWYYPVGLYRNASVTDTVAERGALMWLLIVAFYVYSVSAGQMCIAGMELADNAGNACSLLFTMSILFCGVLAGPDALPGFWIFMYYVSPFTYLVSGMFSTGVANTRVTCSEAEFVSMQPTSGLTCDEYLQPYMAVYGGYVSNGDAMSDCRFCRLKDTNDFLSPSRIYYKNRWREWGIFICYIAINYMFAVFFYWLARVPKSKNRVKNEKKSEAEEELIRVQTVERQLTRQSARSGKSLKEKILNKSG